MTDTKNSPRRLTRPPGRLATRAKLRHECERCGQVVQLEGAGWFRDSDYYELWLLWVARDADTRELHRVYEEERRAHLKTKHRLAKALVALEHANACAGNFEFAAEMARKFELENEDCNV